MNYSEWLAPKRMFPLPIPIPLSSEDLPDNPFLLIASGAVLGSVMTILVTVLLLYLYHSNVSWASPSLWLAHDRRKRLPRLILVVRHGESEANADGTLWKTVPDNLLGLTKQGKQQAQQAGRRIESILAQHHCQRVHLVISPFERTLQTARWLRHSFETRIVRTDIESRIREQEVGNLQGDEFAAYRRQQQKVGRFWYRFPTGESGADVLDRVKSWWYESVLEVNQRYAFDKIDAMVVVTHGLTLRFLLMQLFGWSPTTFHSVWNANNCDLYVLEKDLNKPGVSPYVLNSELGDMPRSSIDVLVKFRDHTNRPNQTLRLEQYLSIPPPRTTRIGLVKHMLAAQYPDLIQSPKDIKGVLFMPFIEGGVVRGRSTSGVYTSGVASQRSKSTLLLSRPSSSSCGEEADDRLSNCSGLDVTTDESGNDIGNNHENGEIRKGLPSLDNKQHSLIISNEQNDNCSDPGEGASQYDVDELDFDNHNNNSDDDDDRNDNDNDFDESYVHQQREWFLKYKLKQCHHNVEQSLRFPCVQIAGINAWEDVWDDDDDDD